MAVGSNPKETFLGRISIPFIWFFKGFFGVHRDTRVFTHVSFQDVVAGHINVWLEENSSAVHREVAVKAWGGEKDL